MTLPFPEAIAFFECLHSAYVFTLDGAATEENKLLPRASTQDRPIDWRGERVFCNPPWSNIPPFIELAATARLACLLLVFGPSISREFDEVSE